MLPESLVCYKTNHSRSALCSLDKHTGIQILAHSAGSTDTSHRTFEPNMIPCATRLPNSSYDTTDTIHPITYDYTYLHTYLPRSTIGLPRSIPRRSLVAELVDTLPSSVQPDTSLYTTCYITTTQCHSTTTTTSKPASTISSQPASSSPHPTPRFPQHGTPAKHTAILFDSGTTTNAIWSTTLRSWCINSALSSEQSCQAWLML